ncbi:MAG: four-carbon acid sugar kinase family protein [Desulforhopalus sp.]
MSEQVVLDISVLGDLVPEWSVDLLPTIQKEIAGSKYKIVILDDDPTGTQTAKDLPVLTHWSKEALRDELAGRYPAFFILTNSRSLPEPAACELAREIGTNLKLASDETGIRTVLISRSDSTLRGHFPAEVNAMAAAMGKGRLPYLILPFFLEGGRYTINDIHYVQEGERLVPAARTSFAQDTAFGFHCSNLKDWVEEKSAGAISAAEVVSVTIDDLRCGGPPRVAEILSDVQPGGACIVNAVSYRDMEVLVTALLEVENSGKEFLYRTAASFVRTRTGLDHRTELLSKGELTSANNHGGLFVIGSYVNKTSLQVTALLNSTNIKAIEIRVDTLLDPVRNKPEIARVAEEASAMLASGRDTAIYTSRQLITGENATASLAIGQTISDSLIDIVHRVTVQPRYLVAKGGITSSDVATKGLGVHRAMVIGQALPGVPAWQLGPETRYPGMSYIIFPGNVGDDDALVRIQRTLQQEALQGGYQDAD